MNEGVRITVLMENSVHRGGLAAEHGLSFHVQIGRHCFLFDTGQTGLVMRNAQTLGIELGQLDAIVLSHGHHDHTGGLSSVLTAAPKARTFLHPAAFGEKFSKSSGQARSIGMSRETVQAVRQRHDVVETTNWTEICKGAFATGEIPRTNTFEDSGGPFFLDAKCQKPDPLVDDQALVIDLGKKLIVLLGCAHAGLINTLDYVAGKTDGKPVRTVIGGLHLGSASEERLQQTIIQLRAANLRCLTPVHCTGWPATARLWQAFPQIYRAASVGTILEF